MGMEGDNCHTSGDIGCLVGRVFFQEEKGSSEKVDSFQMAKRQRVSAML